MTVLAYLSSTVHIYCTSTQFKAKAQQVGVSVQAVTLCSVYLAAPRLLTLGSAVSQHPLLKSSFTKSQRVPQSKQPHLKCVPELHMMAS